MKALSLFSYQSLESIEKKSPESHITQTKIVFNNFNVEFYKTIKSSFSLSKAVLSDKKCILNAPKIQNQSLVKFLK